MQEENQSKKYNIQFYTLLVIFIISGSSTMIFLKNTQNSEALGVNFAKHIWFMSLAMFIGEFSSMFVYLIKKNKSTKPENISEKNLDNDQETPLEVEKEKSENENEKLVRKPPVPTNFVFGISSMMDLIGTTLTNLALVYLAASVNQMLRSTELLFVCIAGLLFLGHKIYRHQILGLFILIVGLFLIGLNGVLYSKNEESSNIFLGIVLLMSGLVLLAGQKVVQETLVRKYDVNSYQLVGFEGLFGLIACTILITIFSFISCDFSEKFKKNVCFSDKDDNSHFEDPIYAFRQMWENKLILIFIILFIVAAAVYNIVGVQVIEVANMTTRGVADTVRTVVIWLFFLFIHPVKDTQETFYPLQLVGFILLVTANIIYNEILEIPFLGLNKYTRRNLEKMEKEQKLSIANKDSGEEDKIISNRESEV